MPSLLLSRATEADIDALLDPLYAAFVDSDPVKVFLGHDTPANRTRTKEFITTSMREGGQSIWLKVADEETGRIISASWWTIYPSWVPANGVTNQHPIDHLEGDEREMGEALLRGMLEHSVRYTHGHPHILLALLFTDPSVQKSGAGSMQVQWGNALADQLFLPWYVKGSPAAYHLYASNGAKDLEHVRNEVKSPSDPTKVWVSEYTVMRREPLRTTLKQKARSNV